MVNDFPDFPSNSCSCPEDVPGPTYRPYTVQQTGVQMLIMELDKNTVIHSKWQHAYNYRIMILLFGQMLI